MKLCAVADCGKKYYCRDMCESHYRKQYRAQPAQRAKRLETQKKYYQREKEKCRENGRRWQKANRQRMNELITQWKRRNPEKVREIERNYRRRNPHVYVEKSAYRRALVLQATPAWADRKAIAEFYKNRPDGYHVDHYYPLKSDFVCGLHVVENLQYLPAQENLKKHNKIK